jgi:hypothetical protein
MYYVTKKKKKKDYQQYYEHWILNEHKILISRKTRQKKYKLNLKIVYYYIYIYNNIYWSVSHTPPTKHRLQMTETKKLCFCYQYHTHRHRLGVCTQVVAYLCV